MGKTEGQLNELKNKSVENSSSQTDSTVIEVLQLWQTLFKETFHQYHRLSTRLVKSQDSSAALKLWHEYLQHVQSFLSSEIPEDYSSLTGHRHLCEIHQNLLTSQQQVLSLKPGFNSEVDLSLMEQFNQLTNLHSETLQRLTNRHLEVENRLLAWEQYRKDQKDSLDWLKEIEKEKSRLQLRYIHLRRVPKTLQRIERLLERLPKGERDAEKLGKQHKQLLNYCDNALATSIRMEHAVITQRISNLRAGLQTWCDFLIKIIKLGEQYERQVHSTQSSFQEIQEILTTTKQDIPSNQTDVQTKLNQLRNQRIRINNIGTDLESIQVLQEELKECVSPFDMKTIRQTVWILYQQQGDLDQQLSALINQIEERSCLHTVFVARYERLFKWIEQMEKRMNCDAEVNVIAMREPEELIKRMEQELQNEMSLKEHDRDWILSTGRELLSGYSNDNRTDLVQTQNVQAMIDSIIDRWDRLKYLSKHRSKKINELKTTMTRLEIRIVEIRSWLYQMEIELTKTLVLDGANKKSIEKLLLEHDKLQKSIEKESKNVGEVFNLCEMLLSDVDTWKTHFNTTQITTSITSLEKRWKNVCVLSSERKSKILITWTLLQEVIHITKDNEKWVNEQNKNLNKIELEITSLTKDQVQNKIHYLNGKIRDIESHEPSLQILEQSYAKLATSTGLEPENLKKIISTQRDCLIKWRSLQPRSYSLLEQLNQNMEIYKEFISAHGKAVVQLTQIDVQLTKIQHLSTPTNPREQKQNIDLIEQDLRSCEELLKKADELGLIVMQKSREEEVANIQSFIDEYQFLWSDINKRLTVIKSTQPQEVDESCQVSTLKFEQDSACQVDTLDRHGISRMTSITPKDAYIYELGAAIKECKANLDSLEKLLEDPKAKAGSQKVSKILANCQSSAELMRHLSTILITESHCSDDEAEVKEVAEQSSRFENLRLLWKAKEAQMLEKRLVVFLVLDFFMVFFFFYLFFNCVMVEEHM